MSRVKMMYLAFALACVPLLAGAVVVWVVVLARMGPRDGGEPIAPDRETPKKERPSQTCAGLRTRLMGSNQEEVTAILGAPDLRDGRAVWIYNRKLASDQATSGGRYETRIFYLPDARRVVRVEFREGGDLK